MVLIISEKHSETRASECCFATCLHLPPPLPAKGRREVVTGSRLMGRPAAIGRRLRGAEGCGRQLRRGRVAAPGAPAL
eukprot:SAG25_NODE_567_length_6885_cov_9.281757_3_plen_78_part_00